MSADPLQTLASAGKGKNTLGLLRVIILTLIAGAAIASRLFSVIRTWPFSSMESRSAVNSRQFRARDRPIRGPITLNCPAHLRSESTVC